MARLIVFSGLPGVGKTTIAKNLAKKIGATYIRIDSIEQALLRSSADIKSVEDAGYIAAYSVTADNLNLGHDVVADCVNPLAMTRNAWIETAQNTSADILTIEVICSDPTEHQRRVEDRSPDIEGHILPSWTEVKKSDYLSWDEASMTIDTAKLDVEACLSRILVRLQNDR